MPTTAMEPTIRKDEKFSAEMAQFQPNRGDLVILEHDGILQVKRVIAVGGDTIEGRDLQVFVNRSLQQEPYVRHTGKRPLGMKTLETFGQISIPQGKLFVAGDNRDFSYDSRDPSFGLISTGDVRGRLLQIVRSSDPKRIGLTPR
jgi:signal peptidase I